MREADDAGGAEDGRLVTGSSLDDAVVLELLDVVERIPWSIAGLRGKIRNKLIICFIVYVMVFCNF